MLDRRRYFEDSDYRLVAVRGQESISVAIGGSDIKFRIAKTVEVDHALSINDLKNLLERTPSSQNFIKIKTGKNGFGLMRKEIREILDNASS